MRNAQGKGPLKAGRLVMSVDGDVSGEWNRILLLPDYDLRPSGHMTGAKNVPLNLLEEKLTGTVKNKNVPLLLVCATGARAQRAVAMAKKLGYEQAQAVSGGLKAWKEANLPVEKA